MLVILGPFISCWRRLAHWRGKLALAFLLLGSPAGAGLAWFTPMGDVADEPSHFARAEGLLFGEILGHRQAPIRSSFGAGVNVDTSSVAVSIFELFPTLHGERLPPKVREEVEAVRWAGTKIYFPTQMVQYFPALYAPAAAGLWVGWAMGVTPLQGAFLGRFFMLASYLAMGWAALRFARFGQPLLFTVLLLPESLMLGASFSQDGQLIAATALAASLLTRSGPKPGAAWGLALMLLTLVACSKPPYAVFLGVCLLPLAWPRFWLRLGLSAGALILPVAWVGLMTSCCYANWATHGYHPGPLWPGAVGQTFHAVNAVDNLEALLAHPAQIVIMPLQLTQDEGRWLWHCMIGELSWLTVSLPPWQIWGWSVALAAAVLACMAQPGPVSRPREAGFAALLIAAAYVGVALALYVSFTRVGDTRIHGVQGRYFLLLWPFLPFALPRGQGGWRRVELLGLTPALAMATADAWALPAFSWHLYRMAGP